MNKRWIGIACLIAMGVASALAYGQLPDNVPTHWNIHGEVDGYASRQVAAVFMPALSALLWAVLRMLARFDPISRHESTNVYLHKAANLLVAFLLVLHLAVLGNGIGLRFNLVQIVGLAEGALLALIGNEMGRLRRNSWAGIRLPWTLNDDEIWRRTHRVGARAFVLAGVTTMLAALLVNGAVLFGIVMATVLGAALFSVGYSYRLALQKRNTSQL
jgi:uncharacterized membrane protein